MCYVLLCFVDSLVADLTVAFMHNPSRLMIFQWLSCRPTRLHNTCMHHVVILHDLRFFCGCRLAKVREAATVIGIQALAEAGTWREVIPFVQQVYTPIAACPAPIMQMWYSLEI